MRVEIVVIGNELLNGDLADTNSARLAGWLRTQGLAVERVQVVPDTVAPIVEALGRAAQAAELVLVSGGLGPTRDDLTMEAAAVFANRPLVEDARTLARIQALFAARGVPLTANNAQQARIPEGAVALDNPVGTAPCVRLALPHRADGVTPGPTFFFFPGVPRELERLLYDHLAPWVLAHAIVRPYRSLLFKTFGKTESQIATLLGELPSDPRVHIAYRAHFPEIRVSFHATEPDAAAATALLAARADATRRALGGLIYAEDEATGLVDVIAAQLVARGQTLATAESCTGGLVAAMCTDAAGASAWFLEGAVTYANAAKVRALGVPEASLAAHGAVSEPVARAMAEGIRARAGSTWGLATTGIAGPGGGTPDKPVGTIHFALAGPDGTTHVQRRFPFERDRNRVVSAWTALDLLRRAVRVDVDT